MMIENGGLADDVAAAARRVELGEDDAPVGVLDLDPRFAVEHELDALCVQHGLALQRGTPLADRR